MRPIAWPVPSEAIYRAARWMTLSGASSAAGPSCCCSLSWRCSLRSFTGAATPLLALADDVHSRRGRTYLPISRASGVTHVTAVLCPASSLRRRAMSGILLGCRRPIRAPGSRRSPSGLERWVAVKNRSTRCSATKVSGSRGPMKRSFAFLAAMHFGRCRTLLVQTSAIHTHLE